MKEIKNFSLTFSTKRQLFDDIGKLLSSNVNQKFFVNVSLRKKKRSLPANSAYYAWLPIISDYMAMTKPEVRRYLKLEFGLPILLSTPIDDMTPAVKALYESLVRSNFFSWDYETQTIEMDSREVTSLMNTKQHSQMREQIQFFYGQQGLDLNYER